MLENLQNFINYFTGGIKSHQPNIIIKAK